MKVANKCELCDNPANKSSIVGDIYYRRICMSCYASLMKSEGESSGLASYNRARDLENHEADVIQPFSGGKPSPEFIHLYPERARQLFSAEEIDQATRS
jgi:hypothetical protein